MFMSAAICKSVTNIFGTVPTDKRNFGVTTQVSIARRSFDVSATPFYRREPLSRAVYMFFFLQHWSSDLEITCLEEMTEGIFQKYFHEMFELVVLAFIYRVLMLSQPGAGENEVNIFVYVYLHI